MSTRVDPTDRLVTADEMMTLPDDDLLHELVRGEHFVNPPQGARHGQIGMRVALLLAQHAVAHRLGVVFSGGTGFLLARDPDTVRAPDAAFVRRERIPPEGIGDRYIEGAPDLAVEVLSPTDSMVEMEEKVDEYLAAGARLVWVVNPKRRTVTVHAPDEPPRVVSEGDRLDGGSAITGFTCEVRELFDWPM